MFDRFCMDKAQTGSRITEEERREKRQHRKNQLQYIIAPVILQLRVTEGQKCAQTDVQRVPL